MDQSSKDRDLEVNREDASGQRMTTDQGLTVATDQNSLRVGSRGPTLMDDFILREKITHFDHERIPERVVHARGSGAHGYFQVYEPLIELTSARFLQDPAVQTPVFTRFSTVAGSRGSADTVRDIRGFATKFYTDAGVFDLVGNNIPVFFIQDAIKFPDLIHAVKPEPNNEIPQASSAHDTFYDFVWLTPESIHTIMWLMSDRAIPRSFRMMDGFGVNTFRLVNAEGKARLVKFHWRSLLGAHSLVWDEAQKLAGKDPDFHRRDLWEAIDQGSFPEYELGLQVIEEDEQLGFSFDPLDPTKIWPESVVPLRKVGKLVLNRNPDSFFAETEQVAFHTANIVPGIDFSNDPLLQGRLFSYLDTQLSRLGGPNFHEIPINRSLAPVHNNQRDGQMRQTINRGRTSYSPNSLSGGCPMQAGLDSSAFKSFAERIDAQKIRERSPSFNDHFSQATMFWNSMSAAEQEHIILAFRFELGKVVNEEIRQHMVELLTNVNNRLATEVASAIGVTAPPSGDGRVAALESLRQGWQRYGVTDFPGERRLEDGFVAPEVSQENTIKGSIKTRKVAVLAADGFDQAALTALKGELTAGGAKAEVVSLRLGMIRGMDGQTVKVDKTLLTTGSIVYDGVFVVGGRASVDALTAEADAPRFVDEAYRHGKAIGALGAGVELVEAANLGLPASSPKRANGNSHNGKVPSNLAGVILNSQAANANSAVREFVEALGAHRFFARARPALAPA